MLFESLEFLRINLNNYITSLDQFPGGSDEEPAQLGNIGIGVEQLGDGDSDLADRVLMSLVNLQEEFALKNNPNFRIARNGLDKKNPPVFLNLFLLVSSNYSDYSMALRMISFVITYFQKQNSFSFSKAPIIESDASSINYSFSDEMKERFSLLVELHTLTFEQLNHLWGALGGKQVPSVLYKIRLVEMDANEINESGELITEIKINN